MSSPLFQPFTLRSVTLRNRVVISPMCQYSAENGHPTDWHLVHLGRFAQGGAGLVIAEATAVSPDGRITHGDTGLWQDSQVAPFARIAQFLADNGAVPGIQLAHAGRKASSQRPWEGSAAISPGASEPPWAVVAPSAVPLGEGWPVPHALDDNAIAQLKQDWRSATRRAADAGFRLLEIHAAHGYLLHEFLSPVSNRRTDRYGGDAAGRLRLPLEIVEIVRETWPADLPLSVRVSAVDGAEGGLGIADTVRFAQALKQRGVDIIDCSSGGISGAVTAARVKRELGFQVEFAETVRREAGIPTMAVGLILEPDHAERIVASGQADLVALAREALFNPNWAAQAYLALDPAGGFDLFPVQAGWYLERREINLQELGVNSLRR